MDRLCNRTFLLMFTVGVVTKSATQDTEVGPTVPATAEASLGSPATINCTFQINAAHLIVNWLFRQTPHNGSKKIEIHDEHYNLERGHTWSRLTIKKVVSDDGGWYFCEVIEEIPPLKHSLSNGAQLIILNFSSPQQALPIKPTGVIVKSTVQDTDKPLIPATVEACSGSSATINCTFQINTTHFIVNWYFNETPFSGSKKIEIHDERYHQEKGETWSSLTIKEVLSNGSGWYFCEVIQHIPQLWQYRSNGSHLIIIEVTLLIPETVEACLGSPAVIKCTYQITATHLRQSWYFSQAPDFSGSKKIEAHDERYHLEKGETWSSLTIKKVVSDDSGWYFCEVIQHVPQLKHYRSNGSHLIIIRVYQDRYSTDTCVPSESFCTVSESLSSVTPAWLIWTGSALGLAVLVIAMAIIWSTRRRDP